jgi:hypothetical protein
MARYFVSPYTDGPLDRWNVIDRQTQEWVRRFPTREAAQAYADKLMGEPSSLLCQFCGATVMFPCSARWKAEQCPVPRQYGLPIKQCEAS